MRYEIWGCVSFLLVLVSFVIGLPIYMVGCSELYGGYCYGFNKVEAKVVSNSCYMTSGYDCYKKSCHDDTIGFNCKVHVQYMMNEKNKICYVYRSDWDDCQPLVTTLSLQRKCDKLNYKNYPINSTHPIYINKVNGYCETHHYVEKYSKIGFYFLIISAFFLLPSIIFYILRKIELNKQTTQIPTNHNIKFFQQNNAHHTPPLQGSSPTTLNNYSQIFNNTTLI